MVHITVDSKVYLNKKWKTKGLARKGPWKLIEKIPRN